MYPIIIFIVIIAIGLYSYSWKHQSNKVWSQPEKKYFPTEWRSILNEEIPFYRGLSIKGRGKFEFKVQEFLLNITIMGVGTEITMLDKILVASSAIIPIFGFKNWQYINLKEVLIYPSIFNTAFETEGPNRNVLGMVGTGYMDGKMILSQEALRDGVIDGIPSALLDKQYVLPWMDYMDKKLDEVFEGDSDINPYGGTNRAEFFSVTSEYFFERPKLLKKKHPELYRLLEKIFQQDLSKRDLIKPVEKISENTR
jgi:hypothetical protein